MNATQWSRQPISRPIASVTSQAVAAHPTTGTSRAGKNQLSWATYSSEFGT